MANKKIRLTYLWTDEKIMLEDFSKKVSQRMTDWANAFYARYGFEFDVDPPANLRSSVARAAKYALKKSDGIRPDMRSGASDAEMEEAAYIRDQEAEANEKAEAANRRYEEMGAQWDAKFATLRPGISDTEHKRILRELDQLSKARGPVADEQLRFLQEASAFRMRAFDLEMMIQTRTTRAIIDSLRVRDQLSAKFASDKIGSGTRLSVVFCRFGGLMAMRPPGKPYGVTFGQLTNPTFSAATGLPIWPYPFVLVDLDGVDRTVAHEIIHAPGRSHPDTKTVFSKKGRRYTGVKLSTRPIRPYSSGTPFKDVEYSTRTYDVYEELSGGMLDGAKNDIMNYELKNPTPTEVILNDADRKMMEERAYFVNPPRP